MRAKGIYLPYLEAREYIRSLGIKSQSEWYKYSKTKEKPCNIPASPYKVYKNTGWVSWMEWLGTNDCVGGSKRIYKVNDDYFKTWSCDMAYILGFWFADGYIRKTVDNGFIFSISQHDKDKYLLEAILKKMDSDYPLYKDKNSNNFAFAISSRMTYDDVVKLGGKERKSLDVKFPNVPEKFSPDFIRGLWDGDGSVFYNKEHKYYCSNYISGSRKFIYGLLATLKKSIPNLKGSVCCESENKYRLNFSKNDTTRLKKFMYQESTEGKLMLKRKHDLFLKNPDDFSRRHYPEFLSYNDSKDFIKSFGFKSLKEWRQGCKNGKIPRNIPHCPYLNYKNSGWVDWYDWLGKSKNLKATSSE